MRENRMVIICASALLAITLFALLAPFASPHDYMTTELDKRFLEPTLADARTEATQQLQAVMRTEAAAISARR